MDLTPAYRRPDRHVDGGDLVFGLLHDKRKVRGNPAIVSMIVVDGVIGYPE